MSTWHSPASNAAGIAWALAGVGLFALIYVSGKLSGTEASALQIMWLRYVGGLLTMLGVIACKRLGPKALATSRPVLHAGRAAAGGFGGVAAVYAAAHMPVASATAIGLLDGLITVLLGCVLLREVVALRQWAATFICLAGALLVVAAQGAFSMWTAAFALPALMAMCGAILVAVESISIKMLVHTEPPITVLFYVNLFGAAILAWPGIANWAAIEAQWLIAFLLLGPVAIVGQYCNIQAFRRAAASVIGPVRYAWILYGTLFGVLFFNEPVSAMAVAGIGLILCGGGWLAVLRNRRG